MSRRNRPRTMPDYAARNASPSSETTPSGEKKNSLKSFQFWIIFFFHLLVLTVPLFFTWVNEELFEFNKIILIYAYTIIIGSLWLGRMITQKKFLWKRSFFDFPILFFLASQLLSTLFSIDFHTSIFGYYTRFNGGLLSTLSYITLYYAFINNVDRKDLSRILFTTFLSGLLVSLLAIPEHFGHSMSCLVIGVSRGNPASLDLYDTSCWIQDVQTRVFATFGQPNWLAAYAITLIPIGWLLSSGKLDKSLHFTIPQWQKWFYTVTTFCLLLTLIFTKSRSGFLGLVVGLAFGAGVLVLKKILSKPKDQPKTFSQLMAKPSYFFIGLQVALALFAVILFGTPYSPSISQLLSRSSAQAPAAVETPTSPAAPTANRLDEGGTDSGEIRKIVWTGAFRVWQRYPIFGSGVETFAYSYYKDRPMAHNLVSEWDFLYNKAHNEFLNFLATTGLIGLLAYLFLLGSIVFLPLAPKNIYSALFQKKLTDSDISSEDELEQNHIFLFGVALSVGIVALSVSNFFGFSTVMVSALLLLLPAMWVVFTNIKATHFVDHSVSDAQTNMTQIVLHCLLFFVSLALLFNVFKMWESDRVYALGKQNSEANQVNVGLPLLEQAVRISPDEPYFYDELAVTDARIAAALAPTNATAAAEYAQRAILLTDQMMQMNKVNLNQYKSKARIYSLLAQLDEKFIHTSIKTLEEARELAPTDPKLLYNISVLKLNMGMTEEGVKGLQEVIKMKSNYIQAHLSLANEYERAGKFAEAKAEYTYILENIQANDPTSLERLQFIATSSAQPVK